MDIRNLLDQFLGSSSDSDHAGSSSSKSGVNPALSGALGGIAAGGLVATLLGSKGSRKLVKKAATYGGAALLGGLAYRSFQNWQASRSNTSVKTYSLDDNLKAGSEFLPQSCPEAESLQTTILLAMIAAAKSDGHIDAQEMKKLYTQIDQSALSSKQKDFIFSALAQDSDVKALAQNVDTYEHKAEVYLAAYLVTSPADDKERHFLDSLATALELPKELIAHLERQAEVALG
jgi:uncharacterized membrane protein YebE (DUF533 family)